MTGACMRFNTHYDWLSARAKYPWANYELCRTETNGNSKLPENCCGER